MEVNKNIPVVFERLENIDDRFMKVKIWLMHTNENYNGSWFGKEAVAKAIPTLANTPILGFLENQDDDTDFSDHRMVVTKKDGDYVTKYLGSAYGVIPEDNNAKFEMRVGDDGVEREYLTCEGLLWQKWDEPIDIMNRDGAKAQSMELHKDYQGEFGEDGLFHFTDFKFFGACILGSDVMPAMNSASVEVFSLGSFESEVQTHMEEFKLAFAKYQQSLDDTNKNNQEGDGNMGEKLLELLAKYSLTEDQVKNLIKIEEYSTEEELEAKLSSIADSFEKDNQIEALKVELETAKGAFESLKGQFDEVVQEKDSIKEQFEALNQEVVELRTFKNEKTSQERVEAIDTLLDGFTNILSEDEISSVRDAVGDKELGTIEFELYALVGKKNFQNKEDGDTKKGNAKFNFSKDKKIEDGDDGYGDLINNYLSKKNKGGK